LQRRCPLWRDQERWIVPGRRCGTPRPLGGSGAGAPRSGTARGPGTDSLS
jgi:hypothetical protein